MLQLSASGTVEVQQDLLSMTLSTTRDGTDAASVQTQLKTALDAALAEARKNAQPGQLDVRTGNFSLSPRYAAATARSPAGRVRPNWCWKAAISRASRRRPAGSRR